MQNALFELPAHVVTFAKFWERWPNKQCSKQTAQKAWDRAIQKGAKPEDIVEGVENYRRQKPSWQGWLHAATFINQARWTHYPKIESADSKIEQIMRGQ